MVDDLKNRLSRTVQFIILLLLSTQVVDAQLLWKISKQDQPDSYILGTHHVIPSSVIENIKGVEEAYKNSEVLVGELDIREMDEFASDANNSMILMAPADSALNKVMRKNSYNSLMELMDKDPNLVQLPKLMANSFKPQMVSSLLSIGLAVKANEKLFPGNDSPMGVDMIFENRAVKEGKEIIGLESMTFQTKLLYDNKSIKKAAEELSDLIDCLDSNPEAVIASSEELAKLYVEQNLEGLLKLADETSSDICPALTMDPLDRKLMVDDRNIDWIPKLKTVMKNNSCFIIVGALHLPGQLGVLELLKKEGYTISSVSK